MTTQELIKLLQQVPTDTVVFVRSPTMATIEGGSGPKYDYCEPEVVLTQTNVYIYDGLIKYSE